MTQKESNSEEYIKTLRRDINRLKTDFSKLDKPWYKDAPKAVAVIGVFFSLAISFYSLGQRKNRAVIEDRLILNSLIEKIASMPRRQEEANVEYHIYPKIRDKIINNLMHEETILAAHALDVAEKLEKK